MPPVHWTPVTVKIKKEGLDKWKVKEKNRVTYSILNIILQLILSTFPVGTEQGLVFPFRRSESDNSYYNPHPKNN